MSIKHAILGLLAAGPAHGYDLKAAFEAVVPQTELNFGQVYSTLDRLERALLVTPEVVAQEKQPDKKVYALTAAGRKELQEWLSTPTSHELDVRNETFLKIMLARRLPGADPLAVLAVERRAGFNRLHELMAARTEAEQKNMGVGRLLPLELTVLRLEAFLKWLDRCEEILARTKQREAKS
jgi:DNA-binding PadR family transcriptional regulator